MNFHESPDFADALQKAAEYLKLRPVFVEKDYWVTSLLKNLSASSYAKDVVFKGGTSLSKAYHCIERFSEDIDLALLKKEEITGGQLKTKLKAVETNITSHLENITHPLEEKRGRNRRTFYLYPQILNEQNFGPTKDTIQLEINAFTNPVPYENIEIESYVAQFLRQNGFSDWIDKHQLDPFTIQVLTRERTFFEKLLSVIRLSYEGTDKVQGKIRHFYDMHILLQQKDLATTLLSENNFELIQMAMQDDASNEIFKGDWMNQPLGNSPLLLDINTYWSSLEAIYKNELSQLIWAEKLPSSEEILNTLERIRFFVEQYDLYRK